MQAHTGRQRGAKKAYQDEGRGRKETDREAVPRRGRGRGIELCFRLATGDEQRAEEDTDGRANAKAA